MPSMRSLALGLMVAAAATAQNTSCTVCDSTPPPCMTGEEAQQVATNFGVLISNYSTALANNVLAENYTDYSESVNSLIDSCPTGNDAGQIPLLAPVFTNRSAFESGQGAQATNNYQQLNIWYSCDVVNFRWETTNAGGGSDPKPVVGLISALVSKQDNADYPWVIDEVFSEFDAAAWLQNLEAAGACANTTTKRSLPHAKRMASL